MLCEVGNWNKGGLAMTHERGRQHGTVTPIDLDWAELVPVAVPDARTALNQYAAVLKNHSTSRDSRRLNG